MFIGAIILIFLLTLLGSYVFNKILLKFSSNLGVRNNQISILRWSDESKPSVGGISFFIVFLLSTLFYLSIDFLGPENAKVEVFGIIFAVVVAFFMGLSDDAYNTTPLLKFLVQVVCGLSLIVSGTYIEVFDTLYLNYAITIVWVIGMMNSVNMLDNMDGITTITSIMILLTGIIFHLKFISDISFLPVVMFTTLASLIGFLWYNWHPSKMFMGDNGSQFLGLFLSVVGIKYFWNLPVIFNHNETAFSFLVIFLVYLIPITDTTTVSINRILKGSSPFVGGKDHTTHHLSYLGLSDSMVAIVYVCIAIVASLSAYVIIMTESTPLIIALFILNLAISVSLFILTKKTGPRKPMIEPANDIPVKDNTLQEKKVFELQTEYNED